MLKERLKFVAKDTVIYGMGNMVSKTLVFLTIPVITKNITVSDFGSWNLLSTLGYVLCAVCLMGMESAVMRYYYDFENTETRKKIFSSGLYIQGLLLMVFILAGFFFPHFFLFPVRFDDDSENFFWLILAWMPGYVFTQYFLIWFRISFQKYRFLFLSVGISLSNFVLLYAAALYSGLTLYKVLFINAISNIFFLLIGMWWLRKYFTISADGEWVKKLIRIGFPMMLVLLTTQLASSLDRFFLVNYLSSDKLGVYLFNQKLTVIFVVFLSAFQMVINPFIFSTWNKPDAPYTFARFQSYYLLIFGIFAIAICSASRWLASIIGTEEYSGSANYFPILIGGYIFTGLYSFSSIGIYHSKKMVYNLVALCSGLFVNAIVNFLLSPLFGEFGAAIAFASGNMAMAILSYLFSKKHYPIRFSFGRDILKIMLLSAMLAGTTFTFVSNTLLDAAIKGIAFSLAFLVMASFLLSANERKFIFQKCRTLFNKQ